ncbi:peptidylprolyl isomerase [Marinobacterium aestuariivivens]|uniref:Peptidyl-prolyl cis-trans isomerase n=1 Tax=Marinobacterium aestuariivivens TaxID=1698799 RepID=A0ABW1ZTW7_9GAMM
MIKPFLKRATLGVALTLATTLPLQAGTLVEMETSAGTLELELFDDQAPKTVANFLDYVDSGFYRGTIFHRVIPGFMIQGGGFTEALERKETQAPVENESINGASNLRGTLSMARTRDPHSATAQFFINSVDNPRLDAQGSQFGYTVFGRVTRGMDVVNAISATPTRILGPHRNVPETAVVIRDIRRVESEPTTP